MKRTSGLVIAAVAACATALAPSAYAQQSPTTPPAALDAQAGTDLFEYVLAAQAVADFARREHDASAFIVAARMLQQVPFTDSGSDAAAPAGDAPASFTVEGLLAEAKVLAKDDPGLLMQINLAQSGSRGVMLSVFGSGLVRILKVVDGGATFAFDIKAKGDELLRVGAIGDPKARMSIRLRDDKGRVVCSDDPGDSAPVCSLRPPAPGNYRVEVLNQTAAATKAVIISN